MARHWGEADHVERRRVVAAGRVQGVWFRESCRRAAAAAGVAGWVRNRADGTVEAVFEGDAAAVDQMVAWMRVGPPRAEVTDVTVHPEAPVGESSFTVR
jgi:acylphosphatase